MTYEELRLYVIPAMNNLQDQINAWNTRLMEANDFHKFYIYLGWYDEAGDIYDGINSLPVIDRPLDESRIHLLKQLAGPYGKVILKMHRMRMK